MCVCVSSFPSLTSSASAGDLPKENPYEDVDLKSRRAGRKPQPLSETSLDSLHRMWSPQDRKYNNPAAQVTAALPAAGPWDPRGAGWGGASAGLRPLVPGNGG